MNKHILLYRKKTGKEKIIFITGFGAKINGNDKKEENNDIMIHVLKHIETPRHK